MSWKLSGLGLVSETARRGLQKCHQGLPPLCLSFTHCLHSRATPKIAVRATDSELPRSNSMTKSKSLFLRHPSKSPMHLTGSIGSYALPEPTTSYRTSLHRLISASMPQPALSYRATSPTPSGEGMDPQTKSAQLL